jgi:hypothetical protein
MMVVVCYKTNGFDATTATCIRALCHWILETFLLTVSEARDARPPDERIAREPHSHLPAAGISLAPLVPAENPSPHRACFGLLASRDHVSDFGDEAYEWTWKAEEQCSLQERKARR